ncbi:hypothetical protein DSM104299_04014 [Baekduia alba]|uniref:branched-chain amino acid ABC transporter permease n=1 Tax=Baekduia alba TaxID=2997333 RepID=UPI00233F7CFC|nr:branched-chain amino acid ABC transporter permease [Baekduia alba]WCB95271.1 hypothetical protein DSM104299_04014 [Baekduia alba]
MTLLRGVTGALALLAVGLALPGALDAFWLSAATATVIYAVVAAGTGVLYGRLGFVSLYQVALLGVGGWVTLRLGHGTSLPFLVVLLVAGAVTALIGALVGLPALRFGGLHLALITLMTAGAAEVVFTTIGFPNGGDGFKGVVTATQSPSPLRRPALGSGDVAFFRYALVVAALVFVVYWLHLRARPGRAWATIRAGEAPARASGIDVLRHKLWALTLTGFGTGVAGALLAASIGSLQATSFTAAQSVILFAVVLVGGAYSLTGAAIAGVFAQLLPSLLDRLSVNGDLLVLLFGIGLVATLTVAPHGVAGQLSGLTRRVVRAS